MQTIEAAVFEGPEQISVEEVDLAEPGDREVCVDIRATGVCRSDYERYEGRGDVPYPIVLGHEGAGVVESVGSAVTTVSRGDHVVLSVVPSCGKCPDCESGHPYRCDLGMEIAFSGTMFDGTRRLSRNGEPVNHFFAQSSFATKAVVPERSAVPIREDVPFENAALLGCGATTGIGAVLNTGSVAPGESVAIFGCGGVGSSAIMAADGVGANPIIGVDIDEKKRSFAETLGATHTIDAESENPPERIREITGDGVDHALEFAGSTEAMEQAILSTSSGGVTVISGSVPEDATLSIDPRTLMRDRTVRGNIAGSLRPRVDIPNYADMHASGTLDLDVLLSETFQLSEIETAFETFESTNNIRSAILF